METIDFKEELIKAQRSSIEMQREIINASEELVSLKNEEIESLKNRIIDLEIDRNLTSKIREQKVWAVKLHISK